MRRKVTVSSIFAVTLLLEFFLLKLFPSSENHLFLPFLVREEDYLGKLGKIKELFLSISYRGYESLPTKKTFIFLESLHSTIYRKNDAESF